MSSRPFESDPPTRSEDKQNATEDLLDALTNGGKTNTSANNSDEMKPYRVAGKKAAALLDPFGVPQTAFLIGIQHDQGGKIDDLYIPIFILPIPLTNNRCTSSPEAIERHLHFYNGILKLVPSLRRELGNITPVRLQKIIRAITKGVSDGRSQDLAAVKQKALKYVSINMSDGLAPPIAESEDKSARGIFHPQLARLMCSRRDVAEFDEDPIAGMEALQEGVFPLKSSRWPMLFYDEDTYDPKDKQVGLLRHHTVKRVYQHLFDGPAWVNGDTTKKAKQAKNEAWALESVDSHIIAYAHIITYITISHAQQWTRTIGEMDLQDTYWRIIEVLDDKSDLWVRETLEWWNRQSKATRFPMDLKHDKRALEDSEDDMAEWRARKATKAASDGLGPRTTGKTIATASAGARTSLRDEDDPFQDYDSLEERTVTPFDSRPKLKAKERWTTQRQAPAKYARVQEHQDSDSESHLQSKEHASTRVRPTYRQDQPESADHDADITLTNEDADIVAHSKNHTIRKKPRFTQNAPAIGATQHHVQFEPNSYPRAQPQPQPMRTSIAGVTTTANQLKQRKFDTHCTSDEDTDTFDYDAPKDRLERGVTQRRQAPAKSTHTTDHPVSDSHPKPKVNKAVWGITSEDTQTTRNRGELEGRALVAKEPHYDNRDTVGHRSVDAVHSPLSELTDNDDNEATNQVVLSEKRAQTESITPSKPRKKAKNSRASTTTTKRNPARKSRVNGF
ncbi:hypothetical protein JVU11DRAFT_11061 [Chiua virens]|nr:hypothetical protein JVU11DRAFT_11061 [Chiua virens]